LQKRRVDSFVSVPKRLCAVLCFWALLNKNRTLAEEMLASADFDNEKVTIINGCFGQRVTVSDFMKSRGREIQNPFSFRY
jgi:hypothetical protein